MKRIWLGSTALAATIFTTSFLAAPAAAQVADETTDNGSIVVTAQRREQSAQDVGIALSVISTEELIKRGVTNINDLQQMAPNLEIEPAFGSGQAQFRIRGVGFQDYATNNAPTVGIYVNEVAYPVPVMTQGLIFDIERVEVLRGPQGTLYGRNTTGGAINFITAKPTDKLSAGATAEYGRFNALKAEGFVSGPLADWAKIRVSAATEQGGAFQHNRVDGSSLGDADKLAGRMLLELTPASPLEMTIDVHGGRDNSENVGLYLLDDFQTSASPGVPGVLIPADSSNRLTGWSISPQLAQDANLPGNKPGRRNRTWGTSANIHYDLGGATLTSITSYDYLKRREYGDYDASSSVEADVFFGSKVKVFSQEARISSSGNGPLQWVAGVYYSHQKLNEEYYSDFTNNYGTYARVNYDQSVESISGYGQVEYKITPQLNLIGGLRYEDEKRKLEGFGSAFGGAQALPPTNVSTKMTPVTGKVSVEYKPVENLLLYASWSKGVKSGGFTAYNTGSTSGIAPFKPETLYAYEAGLKATLSPAVQFDAAAFYYDYRDQQVLDAVCGTNGPVGKFANAAKSHIYGIEGSLRLHPVSGLTIAPYGSYKSGEYDEFEALDLSACRSTRTTAYIDKSGSRVPFPKTELGGTVSYEIPAGGDYRVTPSASFSYRSRGYTWLGTRYEIPPYTLVNADVSFGPEDGSWYVALWGRNIFNVHYDLTRNFFTGANIAQPGRPATYGVRLSVRY